MTIQFNAKTRVLQGTSASRRLRRAGSVPAIVYGSGAPVQIEVDLKNLASGQSIHVSNLNLPNGVKALTHGEDPVVASILALRGGEAAAEETPAA